jgi:DNA-directed RNA polymerase subunit RPC12/RpoP
MAGKKEELRCPGCGRKVHWDERRGRDRVVCPRCRMVFEDRPARLATNGATAGAEGKPRQSAGD